jgi:hypothetical protein
MILHENVEFIYQNSQGQQILMGRFAPFYVLDYEGFGSPQNSITSQQIVGMSGERKTNSHVTYRDLSFDLRVFGNSFEDLKTKEHYIMQVMNPQLAGTMYIMINENVYSIDCEPLTGYEPGQERSGFTSKATVQFRALSPMFKDKSNANQLIYLSSVNKLLEFPLNIIPNFEFATMIPGQITTINNDGDFPVGFELEIDCIGQVTNPKLYNVDTTEFFGWDGTFELGTIFYLSTVDFAKKTWVSTDGVSEANAMGIRMSDSIFLKASIGTNDFVMQADDGAENLQAKLSFTPMKIGV